MARLSSNSNNKQKKIRLKDSEMKEAVTNVIDTLTQEDFHGSFQKLLER